MDRIAKELAKLSSKEKALAKKIITAIVHGESKGLDVKKLRGYNDVFRVRMGSMRIIYRQTREGIKLVSLGRRNDNTYSEF